MKILSNKKHRDLLWTISNLIQTNEGYVRRASKAEAKVKELEYSKTQLSQVIDNLEKDRLYVNLSRDKKGVLHSIKQKP